MKNAAKPSGVLPRTSVEKNCLNASLAILSMGLDSEGAAHGETRALVDSPGTLVAANICAAPQTEAWIEAAQGQALFTGCPAAVVVAHVLPSSQQLCDRNALQLRQPRVNRARLRCSAALARAVGA